MLSHSHQPTMPFLSDLGQTMVAVSCPKSEAVRIHGGANLRKIKIALPWICTKSARFGIPPTGLVFPEPVGPEKGCQVLSAAFPGILPVEEK